MCWYRITLGRHETAKEEEINSRFYAALTTFNYPDGLNLYAQNRKVGVAGQLVILYLPPEAATYCPDMVADYGEPCERPDSSEVSVAVGPGAVDW